MKEPLVSIIMPSYNSKKYILESITSVINQSYSNWELIIVDDCSIDGSALYLSQLIIKLDDIRIRYFKEKTNRGAAYSRNIAINNARGNYLAFLDSDDLWHSNKLKLQIDFMIRNNYSFTFHNYTAYDSLIQKKLYGVTSPLKLNYDSYAKNTIIGCLTVILDKRKFDDCTMPLIKSSHDMALWLKLLKKVDYAFCLEFDLANYRVLRKSNTSSKYKAAIDVWRVYRNIEKINLLKSIYYFSYYSINAIKKRII